MGMNGPWDLPPQLPSEQRPNGMPRGNNWWMNEAPLEPRYDIEETLLGGKLMEPVAGLLGMAGRSIVNRLGKQGYDRFRGRLVSNSKARASRMLKQKDLWVDQSDELEDALMSVDSRIKTPLFSRERGAAYYHNPDQMRSRIVVPVKSGYFGNPRRSAMVARHETGHYYRNSPAEGFDWQRAHNAEKWRSIAREIGDSNYPDRVDRYFRKDNSVELRERAAQLKDFIAERKGIGLDEDFVVTRSDLDWAIDNYLNPAYGNHNNNMEEFLGSIVDRGQLQWNMNRYALGATPFAPIINNRNNRRK